MLGARSCIVLGAFGPFGCHVVALKPSIVSQPEFFKLNYCFKVGDNSCCESACMSVTVLVDENETTICGCLFSLRDK